MTTALAPALFHETPGPATRPKESYDALLRRLSELSVRKYFDPYLDIDWQAPENAIDPADPRFCIDEDSPLARTAWYRALDAESRARFGLEWSAQTLKYGIGFEAVLDRGLLEFQQILPNRSPEFRYALHEIIEEGRHSLMFQEFIDRSGCDPKPISWLQSRIDDQVAHWGRTFPELFFFAVLSGELFIDDSNRAVLRQPAHTVHPLARRIMQIHVTEEARHVCFAENYLHEHLPRTTAWQRLRIAYAVPVIFSDSARIMLTPDRRVCEQFGLDRATLREAFGPKSDHKKHVLRITEPIRALCEEHGILTAMRKPWWRLNGLL